MVALSFAQTLNSGTEDEGTSETTTENGDGDASVDTSENANTEFDEKSEQETELGTLNFSVKSDLYTSNEIVENSLFKGATLFWNAKQDVRYAIIARSDAVDTLVRLAINNISVYSDLYLGEDAGIVFTPSQDEQVSITVFSGGHLDGTIRASDVFQARIDTQVQSEEKEKNTGIKTEIVQEEIVKIGDYVIEVYELPDLPVLVEVPFNEEGMLDRTNLIAHRASNEYRVNFEQDKRAYIRMFSQEFDTLLEVSDRFGRKVISDDWGDGTSFVTFEVPTTDEYYISATSFDGRRQGQYMLQAEMTANEKISEATGQISPASPKVLKKYASEQVVDIGAGEFMTAVVQALDNDIEVAFVKESLEAIHAEPVYKGETNIIPLYVEKDGTYKLLMMSDQKIVSNYIVTFYK